MPLGLGLGITKLKSLVSGLRVRFQGNATITAALDGILRELSADFVSNGTVTAALEAIKLLDVDFSADGTLTADLASFEGLLDLYPNAVAAYSVRLLKIDYTGALVRIRKDTAGQPEKDFYPDSNNELSLDSSDGGTTLGSWIGSNDGYVVTWYSQTGSNDATQSSASAQPKIISGGALITDNGKAAIEFDGVNDVFPIDLGTPFTTEFSGFTVSNRSDSLTDDRSLYTLNKSGTANDYWFRIQNVPSFNQTQVRNKTTGGTNTNNESFSNWNNQMLITHIANTDSNYLKSSIDDGSITTLTTSGSFQEIASGNSYIGSYRKGDSQFHLGTIQEIVFFNVDYIDSQSDILQNINDFYSIY